MARKTYGWDISDQYKLAEAIENEHLIRRKWFQRNKQRLLENLATDSSQLVKKKLKRLREHQAHWEIAEPIMKISKEPPLQTPHKIKNYAADFMRPVDPKVLAILYEKDTTSHEARKNYLRERYKTKPEDKFYITDCTNWNYGWRLKDFPPIQSSEWGQTSIVKETFFQKNTSGLKRDPDVSRKPQLAHPKNSMTL